MNNLKQKPLTLSIIIPVYNEENYLRACLESIAAQTVSPDEVIVVDNNSTDKSVEIAKSFPFVKVVNEPKQHQVYAQARGFNMAHGKIIGRIDADTRLSPTWTENILSHFTLHPESVAVTGGGLPYDMYMARLSKLFFEKFLSLAGLMAGTNLIWGANCAIKKDAWEKARDKASMRHDIWEDYDLSFYLAELGKIEFLKNIEVSAAVFRTLNRPLTKQISYQLMAVRTIALHKGYFLSMLFLLSWLSLTLVYPFIIADKYILQPLLKGGGAFGAIGQFFTWGRNFILDLRP